MTDYSAKSANIQQVTCPPAHLTRSPGDNWWLAVGPIQGGPYADMETALALFRRLVETADADAEDDAPRLHGGTGGGEGGRAT